MTRLNAMTLYEMRKIWKIIYSRAYRTADCQRMANLENNFPYTALKMTEVASIIG